MKVTITLNLKTREAHQLFQRKINGDRLFINAILHKLNKITGLCRKEVPGAHEHYQSLKKSILSLTQQFSNEIHRFREILEIKTGLGDKKITITPTFHSQISIENPLTACLIEFIETYDNLVATIKLLYLAGSFESELDYYANITRIQKTANQALSKILAY
jgi:hypothetical protein